MKQKLILSFALFIASFMHVNAQVTIGSNNDPHPAAVLDLQSTTIPGKGLLLPNVVLANLEEFGFSGDMAKAEGMIIYCPGNSDKGITAGVYLWNGTKWEILFAVNK